MGNCTSKKSSKLPKFTLHMKPAKKSMDKDQAKGDARGLSTKIAPCSRGEATSFGFKRRPASALPMPVQLTSRVSGMRQDPGSGSSVESLCHVAPSTQTPVVTNRPSSTPSPANKRNSPASGVNRFGFRSATPPRGTGQSVNRSPSNRSKSEGPKEAREAFFRPLLQPAGSANSVLGSRVSVNPNSHQFTLKTTQLPKPQYPVRLSEKAVKTVTNYCRRDGPNDSGTSKEASLTEDSGICSTPSGTNLGETDTLHELELSDSSPATNGRGRSFGSRKFEMRVVSANKFELFDKSVGTGAGTNEMARAPRSSVCTGLVQQRTEQYLQRIAGVKDSNRLKTSVIKAQTPITSPHEGTESEEEKVKKDTNKSEKNLRVMYLMNEGVGENDEMLPGEAMADDVSVSFSSDEEISSVERVNRVLPSNVAGSAIRVDAIKLSNQLKKTSTPTFAKLTKEDSSYALFNAEDRTALDEDTLLDLSSESDASGEKDNAREKAAAELNGSTESPDTPSNASLSEGRDFLIDDEIADQPQLCFSTHEDVNLVGSGNNNGSEGTVLATSQGFPMEEPIERRSRDVRRTSVGTLSPCESLLSDDLMMDFDAEDNADRCEHNAGNEMEPAILRNDVRKAWVTLPRSSPGANGKSINGRASSASSSPQSHRSAVSRASTEEDLSIRVDKGTYHHMFQDIVSIKSMLLKLNRLLSESEGTITPYPEEDATMDLKKQVSFLQQQLQQREATLRTLQAEVNRKVNCRTQNDTRTLCNAATQTDRVRPVSTGPSLLQNLPSDANNIVTNGRCRKMSESLEEGTRLRSLPADTILEKVKALSFKPVEVERRSNNCKNVFKITKIDLVLKSDNYGQSELRKT